MNKSSSSSQFGSISSSDLIDAKLEEHQLCGSKQCPGCGHKLEGKPVRIIIIFFASMERFLTKNQYKIRIMLVVPPSAYFHFYFS